MNEKMNFKKGKANGVSCLPLKQCWQVRKGNQISETTPIASGCEPMAGNSFA